MNLKYIKIDIKSIVIDILPYLDENFPNIPIEQRYSKEYLKNCLEVDESVLVDYNWEYLPITNEFKPQIQFYVEDINCKINETVQLVFFSNYNGIYEFDNNTSVGVISNNSFTATSIGEDVVTATFKCEDGRIKQYVFKINVSDVEVE